MSYHSNRARFRDHPSSTGLVVRVVKLRRRWLHRLRLHLGFCQNCWGRAYRSYLCRRCLQHAVETGAYI